MSKLKGIILDESDLDQIRLAGFTNFRQYDDQMDYRDDKRFQEWEIEKLDTLDSLTSEFMQGQCNSKFYVFSDNVISQDMIRNIFPTLKMIEVNSEDYSFDYDYKRDI